MPNTMGNEKLSLEQIITLYKEDPDKLILKAEELCLEVHGPGVLLRGLIEFSNYCGQNCLYCGIRAGNIRVNRYRLSEDEILSAVRSGFERGLRTFVLQSGEDGQWSVLRLCRLAEKIKKICDDKAALTLSLGILKKEEYRDLKKAGADRYLMRFETSDPKLYSYLRNGKSLSDRLRALDYIKELDYDLGSGYMVGLPGETEEIRIENALLCQKLEIDMGGIGPFIPHPQTKLAESEQAPLYLTIKGTALLRMLCPQAHIPATTAAGSLDPEGREKVLQAGANVLMPNIGPVEHKKDYLLYPGKICLDEAGVHCLGCMDLRVKSIGRSLDFSRGDALRRREGR